MITAKEIVEIAGISKSTIRRTSKILEIEPKNQGNKFVYTYTEALKIIRYTNPSFSDESMEEKAKNEEKQARENESKRTKTKENEPERSENEAKTNDSEPERTKSNESEINRIINLLQKELEQKDKQIDMLNDRLAETNKILDQEQQLRALAEQKILAIEEKSEQKKKGFFSRFKKEKADIQE